MIPKYDKYFYENQYMCKHDDQVCHGAKMKDLEYTTISS